jgi:hypothetical protein
VTRGALTARRIGVALVLVVGLVALLALTPAGSASPSRTAANSVSFTDSTGEDAQGPDITTVVVSNDDKGLLTFLINVPNRPTLTGDMLFIVFVDSDANSATGDPQSLGADYAIELDGPLTGSAGIALFRWNGTDFTAAGVAQTTLVFSFANGAATIKLNASELGATKRFGFGVFAVSGITLDPTGDPNFDNIRLDLAPDSGHGFYTYEVKVTPPSLVVKSISRKPLTPRAGKAFSVFVTFARSDGAAPSTAPTATCRATVGGRALRASASVVTGGRATCTWSVPKTAKGKTIRGTITVQADGLKASRPFTARVVA